MEDSYVKCCRLPDQWFHILLSNIQIQPELKAKLLLTRIYNLNQTINLQLYFTNQLTLEHIQVTFEGKAK